MTSVFSKLASEARYKYRFVNFNEQFFFGLSVLIVDKVLFSPFPQDSRTNDNKDVFFRYRF